MSLKLMYGGQGFVVQEPCRRGNPVQCWKYRYAAYFVLCTELTAAVDRKNKNNQKLFRGTFEGKAIFDECMLRG